MNRELFKKKLGPVQLISLSIVALLAGYGIGEVFHSIDPDGHLSSPTLISGTPKPDTLDRNNISICIRNRVETDCVQPVSLETTLNQIVSFSQMLLESKDEMSINSFNNIFGSANILYYSITDYLNNDPNAIDFSVNQSLFREASGGSTINHWQLATTTPYVSTPISLQTPEIISIEPEQHLYFPQIRVDQQGLPIIDIENMDAMGTYFHEWFHGAKAVQDWKIFGTFANETQLYNNPKYTALYEQEEYQAEFYGDVAKISMLKRYGLMDQYYSQLSNDAGFNNNAIDLASIAYFLDQNGITPENPIWPFLYDVTSVQSIYYNRAMFDLTGDKQYQDNINETILKWQNYPWSLEELELVNKMISQGLTEGWILPNSIPPLPETSSAKSELADSLFKDALTRAEAFDELEI